MIEMSLQSFSPKNAPCRKEYSLVEEADEVDEAFEEQRAGSNAQLCAAGCTLWAYVSRERHIRDAID